MGADQTARAEPKTLAVSLFDDDVAVAGPSAPPISRIDELLSLLATIRCRFGNTAVTFSLRWGGSALGAHDVQEARIKELELALEVERAKSTPPVTEERSPRTQGLSDERE